MPRADFDAHRGRLAAFCILGAAAIHLVVVLANAPAFGSREVFYAVVALAQLALASGLARRPSRRLVIVTAVTTVVLVALAGLSRTVGLPIGPPWQTPDAGDAELTASGLELLSAAVLLIKAARQKPRATRSRWSAAGSVVLVAVTLVLTSVGVLSAASETPAAQMSSGHAIALTSLREPPGSEPLRTFTLVAEQRVIDGRTAWTYNGTIPGPELRVTEGDRVRVTLLNQLPVGTTIHWHGVRVPNAEDGVAGLTQDAVPPGGTYIYEFVARDPGTYLFHSHQDTFHQLLRGLFGSLIVVPRTGPVADRDYTLVLHEAPSGSGGDALDTFGGLIVGAPSGQVAAVNGTAGELRLGAQAGERVRLRLIGAVQGDMDVRSIPQMMRAQPQELTLLGVDYRIVALDGHDLNAPQAIGPQRLRLAIGQRYDLSFTMPAGGAVRLVDRFGAESVTIGEGPRPATPDLGALPLFDLLAYGAPAVDPISTRAQFDVTYTMVLGEHYGFHEGQLKVVHSINGQNSPKGTDYPVKQGQVVRFQIDNQTDEFHSMHLHGHYFSVLRRGDQLVRGSPMHLDSLLVGPHERWEIAFLADNPGLWMFHCHVLVHAAFGMSAMVSYPDIHTPFEIGTRSGNKPE